MPLGGWDGSGTLDGKALSLDISATSTQKGAKKEKGTPSISSFFKPAAKVTPPPAPVSVPDSASVVVSVAPPAPVIPVTPYSVWISEVSAALLTILPSPSLPSPPLTSLS